MCTGAELMFAGSLISGGASILGGIEQRNAGIQQQELNKIDARNEIASAQHTVKLIRRQKDAVQGAARAAYAASGVKVDTGSADLVVQDIGTRAAEDMYQTLIEGGQRADRYRTQGKQAADAGSSAMTAGMLNAGASALSGYGTMKGWK